ncbi:MAG: nucleoside triphosphate pyrophosphatase [Candidatus Promineifilaceae bacterium]
MTLILASSSPRRQQLIQFLGLPWQVMVADVDETSVDDPDPAVNVVETARLKAKAVYPLAPTDTAVIAADTIVVLDNRVLGKPTGKKQAKEMLQQLRGRTHQVFTGLVIMNKANGQVVTDVAGIDVPMREYNDQEIEAYIATSDPLDKAGSYAIQHTGFHPVIDFSGCFAGVVGLPLCHLVRSLRKSGISIQADVPAACQSHHNYICPVFEGILA